MARRVSAETRRKISASMRGKRNAVGKHDMSEEGVQAIREAQQLRWIEHYASQDGPIKIVEERQ